MLRVLAQAGADSDKWIGRKDHHFPRSARDVPWCPYGWRSHPLARTANHRAALKTAASASVDAISACPLSTQFDDDTSRSDLDRGRGESCARLLERLRACRSTARAAGARCVRRTSPGTNRSHWPVRELDDGRLLIRCHFGCGDADDHGAVGSSWPTCSRNAIAHQTSRTVRSGLTTSTRHAKRCRRCSVKQPGGAGRGGRGCRPGAQRGRHGTLRAGCGAHPSRL